MANSPRLLNLTAEDINIISKNPPHTLTIPCKGELRLQSCVPPYSLSHVHPLHYVDEVDEAAIPINWAPMALELDKSSPGFKYFDSISQTDGIIVPLEVAQWLARTCHPGRIFSVPIEEEKIVSDDKGKKGFLCLNLHFPDYS